MHLNLKTITAVLVASFATVEALPSKFGAFKPAGPGDQRSPCPAMNTMANHGALPHDGKGITKNILRKAVQDTFNMADDLAGFFADFTDLFVKDPTKDAFNLDDIKKHNVIEHDASITRVDVGLGDPVRLNKPLFDEFINLAEGGRITENSLAKIRKIRADQCFANNPKCTLDQSELFASFSEAASVLVVFGQGQDISVADTKSFFENEKIPDGFKTAAQPITLASLNGLHTKIEDLSKTVDVGTGKANAKAPAKGKGSK